MKRFVLNAVTLALLTFAIWTVSAERASACYYGGCGTALAGIGVGMLTVGSADLMLVVVDVVYAARGQWLPQGWAVANIVIGLLHVVAGAITLATVRWDGHAPAVGAGFGLLGGGLLMFVDGVLSLNLRAPPAPGPPLGDPMSHAGAMLSLESSF